MEAVGGARIRAAGQGGMGLGCGAGARPERDGAAGRARDRSGTGRGCRRATGAGRGRQPGQDRVGVQARARDRGGPRRCRAGRVSGAGRGREQRRVEGDAPAAGRGRSSTSGRDRGAVARPTGAGRGQPCGPVDRVGHQASECGVWWVVRVPGTRGTPGNLYGGTSGVEMVVAASTRDGVARLGPGDRRPGAALSAATGARRPDADSGQIEEGPRENTPGAPPRTAS